ncbi:hypothetical protein N9V34_02455 [Flavobacteriaceae bacterium]|nr:hypothetical protein [Flavobacteriaceae bacterium]
MKKLLFTLALIFTLVSYSQEFVIENTGIIWDVKTMTIKGDVDGLNFDGKLTVQKIGYQDYHTLENESGSFALSFLTTPSKYKDKSTVYRIYISENSLKNLVKGIKKKNFSKLSMKYEGEMSYVINKEVFDKKQKSEEQLQANIQKYGGVYKVKIVRSSGISFDNELGTLYITEAGITLKTEIYSMDRISGSYAMPFTNEIEEGMFTGNLGKGTTLYDNFTLSINDKGTAAGLTLATDSYKQMDTTSMILLEKTSGLE